MRFLCFKLAVSVIALAGAAMALGQGPAYHLGRTPTPEEIKDWDIAISPEGKELPPGKGTVKEGAPIFAEKCAVCHGANGEGTKGYPRLVGGRGTLNTINAVKTAGSYWCCSTSIWDYINRAMPYDKPGSLRANEVYALTAFLLYKNDIIKEADVLDEKSLPKVAMPNRDGFIPSPWRDWNPQDKKKPRQFGTYVD